MLQRNPISCLPSSLFAKDRMAPELLRKLPDIIGKEIGKRFVDHLTWVEGGRRGELGRELRGAPTEG